MVMRSLYAELKGELLEMGLTEESASLEALELACFSAGVSRDKWFSLSLGEAELVCDPKELISRRKKGEPLAYILGEWDFYGLTLKTDARALIPRDDSCSVLELFLSRLPRKSGMKVLDLCTGTGCLGLAAASQRPDLSVVLCDLSGAALSLAKENISLLGMENRVSAVMGDALAAPEFEPASFDGVICNPPYLRKDELENTFEPLMALDGGTDGLEFYRSVCQKWSSVLLPGAPLCFEIGWTQREDVEKLLACSGFEDIVSVKDLSGLDRGVCGIKKA